MIQGTSFLIFLKIQLATIKWGPQSIPLEVDTTQDAMTLKAQLYAVTLVPIDKQKIILPGGKMITDNTDLKSLNLPPTITMMLIGTTEEKVAKFDPNKKAVFMEDLTSADKAKIYREKTGENIPVGLINLGNTCYLNSTIQVLRKAKELLESLKTFNGQYNNPDPMVGFVSSLRDTYQVLDMHGDSVRPLNLIIQLKRAFPQFAEVDEQGHSKQQDAEECFGGILNTIMMVQPQNVVRELFEIQYTVKMKNLEIKEEKETIAVENTLKLNCHIDNESNPITNLREGIKQSMTSGLTKKSEIAGRDCQYIRTYEIARLPGYVIVHFVRFFWKQASSLAATKAGKAKILRSVDFPKVLDLYEYCSSEVKAKLDPGRVEEIKQMDEETKKMLESKQEDNKDDDEEENKGLMPSDIYKEKKGEKELVIQDEFINMPFGTGMDTGKYHLVGVVTHKGRYADSGHYVGWVYHKSSKIFIIYNNYRYLDKV